MGPSAMRVANLNARTAALGDAVEDLGNVAVEQAESSPEGDPHAKYLEQIAATCNRLAVLVGKTLARGSLPLVLGGDHSVAVGTVSGISQFFREQNQKAGLIWLDAHADMNTPESSPSGNVHGMPLAALLGHEPAELAKIGTSFPKVRPEKTVLIGIRNLDEAEKTQVRDAGVHVFTMKDLDRIGIAKVMERAMAIATDGTVGVHVSFDMDACDPAIAPGVGTPVKGGLNYREAHMVMEMLADADRLLALDLVEVNPILDIQNQTAVLCVELVLSAFGMRIL